MTDNPSSPPDNDPWVSYSFPAEDKGILSPKNKGNLAPAPYHNSSVSDYLGYGSFSGADIKVIVHYPSSQGVQKTIQTDISGLQRQIAEKQDSIEYYGAILAGGTPRTNQKRAIPSSHAQLASIINSEQEELASLNLALDRAQDEMSSFTQTPSSKVLGEIQTFSWSIFREKTPVRTLGSVYPRSYTRGPRTISGTMIFTVFHQHVLSEIIDLNLGYYSTGTTDHDRHLYTTNLADQLPPLDISLVFANEYGAISHMGVWGVEFGQEGGTFSIEDIYSESVVQYYARDLDPMRLVHQRKLDHHGVTDEWTKTASQLLKQRTSRLDGHLIRRNPYI